jgi:plastocyanin
MNRAIPVLALVLIGFGVLGLVAVGVLFQSPLTYNAPQQNSAPFGMMGGPSTGSGWRGGMMGGRGFGYGSAPNVNATPVPASQPIDREVKITARNLQFDPARVVVKKGETVKFVITNQDAAAHNFVSQDGNVVYTFLPPNATQSVVWVAQEKGTYTALCTFHAGMQMQIVVE